jgi:SAM-dependent methyltransferase
LPDAAAMAEAGRVAEHSATTDGPGFDDLSEAGWDARYSSADRVWSGEPNGALVAEAADLPPGRALDVGCGEGADAVWLATRGWQVTALDISRIALDRTRRHAAEAGVHVDVRHGDFVEVDVSGPFDLVSAQYPVLRRTPDRVAERTLIDLVAPGGVLLFVHHADFDADHAHDRGWDPADYVGPDEVAAALDDGWRVDVHARRPRSVSAGAGSGHTTDIVLRATRMR